MRLTITSVLLTCLVLTGCRHPGVRGSGVEKSEQRPLAGFAAVDISGAFDVTITCGEQPGATIHGDDNLLPLIKTEVSGSTLHLYPEKDINPRKHLTVEITTPSLTDVSVSGVATIDMRRVQGEKLSLHVNGAASIRAEGTVHDADFKISGAGKISADDLHAANVVVGMSGAGKADVNATEKLDVEVSGAGRVHYSGDPKTITKHISGLGFVSRK